MAESRARISPSLEDYLEAVLELAAMMTTHALPMWPPSSGVQGQRQPGHGSLGRPRADKPRGTGQSTSQKTDGMQLRPFAGGTARSSLSSSLC